MARHSIDAALLAADADDRRGPTGLRVWIDAPYESAKVSLLSGAAQANRCRSVWHKHLGACTVLGFEADLAAVDALFTSLLVQATHAMTLAGSRVDARAAPAHARSGTASWWRSRSASGSGSPKPRGARSGKRPREPAATACCRCSPRGRPRSSGICPSCSPGCAGAARISAGDGEGWASGRAAADRAALGVRGRLPA